MNSDPLCALACPDFWILGNLKQQRQEPQINTYVPPCLQPASCCSSLLGPDLELCKARDGVFREGNSFSTLPWASSTNRSRVPLDVLCTFGGSGQRPGDARDCPYQWSREVPSNTHVSYVFPMYLKRTFLFEAQEAKNRYKKNEHMVLKRQDSEGKQETNRQQQNREQMLKQKTSGMVGTLGAEYLVMRFQP